jgi:5'-nucleotidase
MNLVTKISFIVWFGLQMGCRDRDSTVLAKKEAFQADLRIIATTDFHGALKPITNADGTKQGGAGLFAAHIKRIISESSHPYILIDAGDLFSGVTMASDLNEGEPVVKLYNYLGYDAAAVGNHEFDFGPAGEKNVPESESDDGLGALRLRIRESQFEFLASNIFNLVDNKVFVRSSLVKLKGSIRIGIIGATAKSTPDQTIPDNLKTLKFAADAAPLIEAEADRLRRDEKVDFVILTIHDGGSCSVNTISALSDLGSCSIREIFEIIDRIPSNRIDAVVAGHTHATVVKRYRGVPVLQAPAKGMGVLFADLSKNSDSMLYPAQLTCSRISSSHHQGCNSSGERVDPDKGAEDIVRPYLEQMETIERRHSGITATSRFEAGCYTKECALGNLVADLVRSAVQTDLGLINNGGLRRSIEAGSINYGDIYALAPFPNRVAVLTVTGSQLRELVRIGATGKDSFGERYSWSGLRARLNGQELVELKIGEHAVEDSKTYTIATSDFLASGGSGLKNAGLKMNQVSILKQRLLRDEVFEALQTMSKSTSKIDPKSYFARDAQRVQL